MRTVFVDVDTQLDFLYPAGALAVNDGAQLVPGLAALTHFAARNKIMVLSTTDSHTENDVEFRHWAPHCVLGSIGQKKSAATLLPQPTVLPNIELAAEHIRSHADSAQVIVEKQNIDCFTNVNLRSLLAALDAQRFVVYGVVAEVCVEKALFGLLQSGARVECVIDGTRAISEPRMRNMLAHFQAAGGVLTTIGQATA